MVRVRKDFVVGESQLDIAPKWDQPGMVKLQLPKGRATQDMFDCSAARQR